MKNKAGTLLRSFGMSGYQITSDIQEIEKSFNLELGHLPPDHRSQEPDYYLQFEQQTRVEAAEMAAHYKAFYC